MSKHDARRAGESYTGDVHSRRDQFRLIPNAGRRRGYVRVICEQRLAGNRAFA